MLAKYKRVKHKQYTNVQQEMVAHVSSS